VLPPPLPGESPGGRRPAGEPTGRWRRSLPRRCRPGTPLREDAAPCQARSRRTIRAWRSVPPG
jgi:hypothetical protein